MDGILEISGIRSLTDWMLKGDVAIQYQLHLDLLDQERPDLKERIAQEGWGAAFLAAAHPDAYWGQGFYQPKWISSHYTLLDLRNLCLPKNNPFVRRAIHKILDERKSPDGGVNPARSIANSDVCVNGMFLNYATYFGIEEERLHSVIDFVLSQKMQDGGFNCMKNRSGAHHSSLHSTISVLEGLTQYRNEGYSYRTEEILEAEQSAREFVLLHRLFLSDRTGEIIKKDFLTLAYPSRWKYDILRAMDYFRLAGIDWDERMLPAVEVLQRKRRKDGSWPMQAKHPGQLHFEMEKAGKSSRWNSLRVLRVYKHFQLLHLL